MPNTMPNRPAQHVVRSPAPTGTAVATKPVKTALTILEDARVRIAPFLPRGMTFERVMGEVGLAVKENPKIAECVPESVVRSVIRSLRMDLEIGVEFYLVPFFDSRKNVLVCVGIAGYRGLANLAVRCGAARSVQAHCVYEFDDFVLSYGLQPDMRHSPVLDPTKRGALIGAYYLIELPRGVPLYGFLPLAEIEEVRKTSKEWNPTKVPQIPPWWARKRAVLVGLSLVPKNVRFAAALAKVDAIEDEEEDVTEPVPINEPPLIHDGGVSEYDDDDLLASDRALLGE